MPRFYVNDDHKSSDDGVDDEDDYDQNEDANYEQNSGSAVSNNGHEPRGTFGYRKKVRIHNLELSELLGVVKK